MVKLNPVHFSDSPSALPLVSVILPTHNRRHMLAEAIESVLNQTYWPIELVVVDDGSTDGTADLLKSYGDRVRVITQPQQGVSAARNAGICKASGQWIALLDSDDTWLPKKIERQMSYCLSVPNVLICQTEEIWIRNGQRVNPKNRHKKMAGMIFENSLPLCLISPSAVIMHRRLLDDVGLFDETLPACEDYDLWLRITWKYPIHLIDQALIVKRGGHPDQLSRMPQLDKYRIQAIVKILELNCLSKKQQTAAIKTLKKKCVIFATGCEKRGRQDEGEFFRDLAEQW